LSNVTLLYGTRLMSGFEAHPPFVIAWWKVFTVLLTANRNAKHFCLESLFTFYDDFTICDLL